jgi:hypothetical protein
MFFFVCVFFLSLAYCSQLQFDNWPLLNEYTSLHHHLTLLTGAGQREVSHLRRRSIDNHNSLREFCGSQHRAHRNLKL